ncbi:MAG: hypothetical protein HY851_01625, partial [candidate division Zixibacteria bacterium]|nr:hypothetical protein [candidate division Zixibacteria bacterium]
IAAAEAFDGVNVHAPGTGQTVVMSQSTPGSLLNNPGMAFTTSGARFEFGYTRRYDLAELDRLHFAVAARKGAFSLAGGLSQSGKTSLYSERIVKATISMERGRFAFGLTGSSMAVQFGNNYGRFNAFTLGGGVGIRSPQVLASLAVDNITRPKLYDGAPPYPRLAAFNLELLTKKKLSLMVRTVMTESEKPRVGLGQRIPLAKRSALYWGVSTRPLEYGGGIDIGTPRFVFTYAASIHPVLGFSHTISLGLGTKSAKVEPPGGEEGDF